MPAAQPAVIDALQRSVALHLTAIEHYQSLAEHLGRWGYTKLATRFREEVTDERDHLHAVMARLEYYDVQPTYMHDATLWPRFDVPGILAASLTLETAAAAAERQGVLDAMIVGDESTASVFATLLHGSEESIREIEADRLVISQVGLDNWLANQT
jgi:bacterioferritin (cytochrome b1)